MLRSFSFILLIFCFSISFSQDEIADISSAKPDSAFNVLLSALENQDVGYVWSGPQSAESRLGFIGDDFQRLYITFKSLIQNYDNPFEYFIYGEFTLKEISCEFQGSLIISETGFIEDSSFPGIKRAYLSGDYVFFEKQSCLGSGIFRGDFISSIYLDENGMVHYDDVYEDKPNFTNNEFFGYFYPYSTGEIMKANWGDKRIPDSGLLDVGKEKFQPSFRYLDKGWEEER